MALVGATASGKSAVAVEVAAALGDVEIVTADSMQVYRGMDIGTAKPTLAERAGIAHHLIDVADPADDMTVVAWADAARSVIAGIEARGRRALLVGGTGLYVQALVDGFTPPGRWPDVVASLEPEPTADLHARLRALDPLGASRIDPANRRRTLRALEVTIGSGRPFSAFGPGIAAFPATRWRIAGLWSPRAVAASRIEARFAAMLDAGLVEEVRSLGPMSRTARQALGYREVLDHLEGGVPLAEAAATAVARTRAFARRQRMWWRRDPRITWFATVGNPLAATAAVLGDWGHDD